MINPHRLFFLFYLFITPIANAAGSHFLTLESVLSSVDRCFPEVLAARYELGQAQGELITAQGKFDPSLKTKTSTAPIGGYITNYVNSEVNVPTLKNGIRMFGGYRIGRGNFPVYYQNYWTNSSGEYRLGMALPLLQGKSIDKARAALFNQREAVNIKIHNIHSKKIEVYRDAIVAYWQWVEAALKLKALQQLLDLAQTRQEAIIKQVQHGDLARVAIAENEQLILQRQQMINQGNMFLEQSAMNLALYFRDKQGKPQIPSLSQIPDQDTFLGFNQTSRVKITNDQIRRHPNLSKINGHYKIAKMQLALARNDLLPNLDAMSYTSKQYGAVGQPLLVPQALRVGLHFYFPIYQREARGRIISTKSALNRLHTQKNYLTDQLKQEAANLRIALKTFKQQIVVITHELSLAKKVEEAEVERFYQGDSTLFLVNQREQATVQALINQIEVQASLQQTAYLMRYFTIPEKLA